MPFKMHLNPSTVSNLLADTYKQLEQATMKSHIPLLIFLPTLTLAKSYTIAVGLVPQRFSPDVITGVQFNDMYVHPPISTHL
jgi:hypothetical protein